MNKNTLNNPKKTITANEINKFIYCPYQWYYERLYGTKELRRLYRERNEKYGYTDSNKSNFAKGLKFHERFGRFEKLRRIIKYLFLALLFIFACIIVFYLYIYFGE